jgi:probable phosphoglycerate mutase
MSSLIDEKPGSISNSMSQLYLFRHGETDWNVQKRLQGRTDTSLNDVGRTQAKRHGLELKAELARGLKNSDLKTDLNDWYFVSSPLKRCKETMDILLHALGLPDHSYDTDQRLLEISFGEWEGKSWAELRAEVPDLVQARFDNPWDVCGPQGETYTELKTRVCNWYESLPSKTIAVTHSGPSRIVRDCVCSVKRDEILTLTSPQDSFLAVTHKGYEWI